MTADHLIQKLHESKVLKFEHDDRRSQLRIRRSLESYVASHRTMFEVISSTPYTLFIRRIR